MVQLVISAILLHQHIVLKGQAGAVQETRLEGGMVALCQASGKSGCDRVPRVMVWYYVSHPTLFWLR